MRSTGDPPCFRKFNQKIKDVREVSSDQNAGPRDGATHRHRLQLTRGLRFVSLSHLPRSEWIRQSQIGSAAHTVCFALLGVHLKEISSGLTYNNVYPPRLMHANLTYRVFQFVTLFCTRLRNAEEEAEDLRYVDPLQARQITLHFFQGVPRCTLVDRQDLPAIVVVAKTQYPQ